VRGAIGRARSPGPPGPNAPPGEELAGAALVAREAAGTAPNPARSVARKWPIGGA